MKSNKKVLDDKEEKVDDALALFLEFWGDDVNETEKNQVETLAAMLLLEEKKMTKKVKDGIIYLLSLAKESCQFKILADALDFVKSSLLPGMKKFFSMVFDNKDPIILYIVELDDDRKDFLSVQIQAKKKLSGKTSLQDYVLESFTSVCQLFENATDTQLAEHMISFLKSWKQGRVVCFWKVETVGCKKTVTNCAAPVLDIYPRRLSTDMSNSATIAALDAEAVPRKRRPTGLTYNTSRKKQNSAEKVNGDDDEKNES